MSPQALSKLYNEKLDLAKNSEPVTDNFVDQALTIHNRIVLRTPRVFQMLLALDAAEGTTNPLG